MAQVAEYDVVKHDAQVHVSLRSVWRHHSVRRLALVGVALSFILLACAEQWRLLKSLLIRQMNADHALLWLAAREWSRLSLREPTFYGQTYGVTFEGIPTAMLHALGVPYPYALPLALFLLAWGAWLWLAASALRRGMRVAGFAALAAPCLLSFKHWIVVGVIATGVGRLMAAICAGMIVRGIHKPSQAFTAAAVGGLGVAFDSASLVLAGPALVWAGLSWLRVRRFWLPVASAMLAPAAWVLLNVWFNQVHPDHDMHNTWSFEPHLEPLRSNLQDPDLLFGIQSLELWHKGATIPVLLACLLLLALCARAWREVAAVSCVIAQLTYLGSLDKSLDDLGTLWFPAARMTLGVPMAMWFLTTVTVHACLTRWRKLRPACSFAQALALPLLVLLAAGSAAARAQGWDRRIYWIEQAGIEPTFLQLSHPWDIEAICTQAQSAAKDWGTAIVAFPTEGTANYACPAMYPELVTVFPSYERRYWVLNDLANTETRRMILWGKSDKFCRLRRVAGLFTECHGVASGQAVAVAWQDKDPLQVLRALRYKVRPFGPGCRPKDTSTCKWWVERYLR